MTTAFSPSSYEAEGVYKLIELVKEKPVIWNKEIEDIRKIEEKKAEWVEVTALWREALPNLNNWTDDRLKLCWKTLVRYYRRYKDSNPNSKYIPQLAFLVQSEHASRGYYCAPQPQPQPQPHPRVSVSVSAQLQNDCSEDEHDEPMPSSSMGSGSSGEELVNDDTSSEDGEGDSKMEFREELQSVLMKLMETNDQQRIRMEKYAVDQVFEIGRDYLQLKKNQKL